MEAFEFVCYIGFFKPAKSHGCLGVATTVDLVHNEFCMRNLFLQTKMVVGHKCMVLGC